MDLENRNVYKALKIFCDRQKLKVEFNREVTQNVNQIISRLY